jgi:hypothetical protein
MTNLVAEANVTEGTFTHREMTEAELLEDTQKQIEAAKNEKIENAEKEAKAAEKAALLAKLGITADEAALLLGAN